METTREGKTDESQEKDSREEEERKAAYQEALREFLAAVKNCEATSEAYVAALEKHSIAQRAEREAHQEVLRADAQTLDAKVRVLEAQLQLEKAKMCL